jgi:hypothetical protein
MRKLLLLLILLFAVRSADAQATNSSASNPLGGNVNLVDAGTCSTYGSYFWQKLPLNASTTTVNLAGTFSGTVTVRESNNGGATWTTAGTQTGVGTSSYATNGFTDVCADVTTYASGIIQITVTTGVGVNSGGMGAGVSSVNTLTGAVTLAAGVNTTITPAGNTLTIASTGLSGLTTGFIPKAASASTATNSLCDEGISVANTMTCTDTAGVAAPSFASTASTAGFVDYAQGATSAAAALCVTATSICEQAPTSVTYYLVIKPGAVAQGVETNTVTSAVDTQGFSGDANHSASVTIGSGTSIGSTSLCSTGNCPVGTYRVNVYVDITTACGTTGTYLVNLIYTDDQGSKTAIVNIQGSGAVPATGLLTTTSTANYGQASQIIRSTGAASINYSTTAAACGTAGPMVGKLYLSVEPLQ